MHKVWDSAINYIKIFQNAMALVISVVDTYTKYQLMHTFIDNFQQGGKCSFQIESQKLKWIREEKVIDQKTLSISDLQNR